MKQKDRAKKLSGAPGFESYYSSLLGSRWSSIRNSFSRDCDYVEWKCGGEPYFLDSGSVRAAVSLPLAGAGRILDMCAAPGGKTLVLAANMDANAVLVANERSSERCRRLARIVHDCLPENVRSRVAVTCRDAAQLCLNNVEPFDRILLDAPCSSERHVFSDEKYLGAWSPSRIRTLSVAQWALLSSAWRMLAPGGYLLYSTCALSPCENDGVVGRLLKKFGDAAVCAPEIQLAYRRFADSALPGCEDTEFGRIVLPDTQNGAGPLYFCLVHKQNECSGV